MLKKIGENSLTIVWETVEGADSYQVYLADTNYDTTKYRLMQEGAELTYTLQKATYVPHYLKIVALKEGMEIAKSDVLKTPVKKVFHEQIETLNRGSVCSCCGCKWCRRRTMSGSEMLGEGISGYSDQKTRGWSDTCRRGI